MIGLPVLSGFVPLLLFRVQHIFDDWWFCIDPGPPSEPFRRPSFRRRLDTIILYRPLLIVAFEFSG